MFSSYSVVSCPTIKIQYFLMKMSIVLITIGSTKNRLGSLVPRLSLLPRNNSTFDRCQRSYMELLRGRRESLGTRLQVGCTAPFREPDVGLLKN